ncbi:hypothetical protein AM500_16275 [Bacillus sp. FJAT-18017]|nr:hypothetical protein AM500_16275 [Bacillus sp. FJAT-18017]
MNPPKNKTKSCPRGSFLFFALEEDLEDPTNKKWLVRSSIRILEDLMSKKLFTGSSIKGLEDSMSKKWSVWSSIKALEDPLAKSFLEPNSPY